MIGDRVAVIFGQTLLQAANDLASRMIANAIAHLSTSPRVMRYEHITGTSAQATKSSSRPIRDLRAIELPDCCSAILDQCVQTSRANSVGAIDREFGFETNVEVGDAQL